MEMKVKVHNFLNSPWVAFPLMILVLILFMMLGFKCESVVLHRGTLLEYLSETH
jgi:hypothetical protein